MDFVSGIESPPSALAGGAESRGGENYGADVHTLGCIARCVG